MDLARPCLDVGLHTNRTEEVRRSYDVAMTSFVRDPDGSWIKVSQRASLTGPLPST